LQEPEVSDERLSLFAWFVAVIVLALWTRALTRFGRSLTRRPALPIAVVGLVKPRVVFDPALSHVLDADAFGAALAHEEAHRRHRDPLRIALAQLAIDLQWPWPQARRRLASWREALEEARDDEAVCDGAHPDDLAAAIIGAARLAGEGAGAALTGTHAIERRIGRLLESGPRERPDHSVAFTAFVVIGLLTAAVVGFLYGDELIALLPGVMR
jgi:beta-lactamase regulating signal transducer with metallopeptidase domain